MQLKPKLHQLWRIALWFGKLQLGVFLKMVGVFWLEHVVPPRGNSLWSVLLLPPCDQIACYMLTKQPMSIRPVNSQCSRHRSLYQDLMHSGCCGTVVPNVCLQAFSLFPFPTLLDQRPVHRLASTGLSHYLWHLWSWRHLIWGWYFPKVYAETPPENLSVSQGRLRRFKGKLNSPLLPTIYPPREYNSVDENWSYTSQKILKATNNFIPHRIRSLGGR